MPDITIAAKRYDGGSALATYTGCIPLAPGQLFETNTGLASGTPLVAQSSLRGSVSLRRADTGAEIPAYISALYPQHPDGSIKVVMVSTILTLASGVQFDMLLRLGTAPTLAPSPTAHPTINQMWMKFPFLIGCTDSVHMCASRVAFGPLVPVNHANLPQNWRDFLTTELENGSGGFPTYKTALASLAAQGDIGVKLGTLTGGSAVITNIQAPWPTPTSPSTDQITVNQIVSTTGNQTPPGARVASIDGPNQVTLTLPAGAGFATRPYEIHFEPVHPSQDAMYNALAPLYYRYLTATTGHLDKLRDAHLLACCRRGDVWAWNGRNTENNWGFLNYGNGNRALYDAPYTDEFGVLHATASVFDYDEYGQTDGGFNPAGVSAPSSGFHQNAWMCYVLSGWRQPLGAMIAYGGAQFLAASGTLAPFRGYPWPDISAGVAGGPSGFHSPTAPGGFDGARQMFRFFREADVFLYMLSLPMDLRQFGGGWKMPSPRMASYPYGTVPPLSNRGKYLTFFQRKHWDSTDLWSTEPYVPAPEGPDNQFLAGLWGFSPYYLQWSAGEPDAAHVRGTCPIFQLQMCFNDLATVYMNILEDTRWQPKMGQLADALAAQSVGVVASGTMPSQNAFAAARPTNPPMHTLPYRYCNPAVLFTAPGAPVDPSLGGLAYWNTSIVLCLLTWGWRITGNQTLLDMADGAATIYHNAIGITATGGGQVPFSFKTIGECFHMAHYAAAYRAGETWGVAPAAGAGPDPISANLGQPIESDLALDITPQGGVAMANFTFNVAKGRVNEFHNRVKVGDPSTSRLLWVALATSGLEADAVLLDFNTLAEVLAGATNEVTNTGYARLVVAAAALAALSPDDTNDRMDVDIPDPAWAAITAGDGWSKLVLCYDPNNAATDDANTIPLVCFDFVIVPNGGPITGIVNAAGYHRAQQG